MSNLLKKWVSGSGSNVIIRYRYLFVFLTVVLIALSIPGLQKLEMDSSNEAFLPADDPVIASNERFKEIFGNEEFIFILVESEEIFSYDVLSYLRILTEDLEKNLPFVEEVTSLTSLDYIETVNESLMIDNLIGEEIPRDKETLDDLKRKVLSKKNYIGKIITRDCSKTGIYITFKKIPEKVYAPVGNNFSPLDQVNYPPEEVLMSSDLKNEPEVGLNKVEDPRKLIAPALKTILARHEHSNIRTTATGVALLDFEADRLVYEEGAKFGLIALIVASLLMVVLFRSFRAVIGTFLVILSSLVILFGLLGWLNLKLSIMALIIPTLILVISVSYSIHVINHFQYALKNKGSRSAAIKYTYREASWHIFVTAITTALGFVSFIFLPIKPLKVVGISCGIGTFLTYLLVMVIIPVVFSVGKEKKDTRKTVNPSDTTPFRKMMVRWANFVTSNIKLTVILTIILVVILGIFSSQMPINSDMLKVIGDDVEFVKNAHYVTDKLGALYSYEVLIEFPEEGMVKKSQILRDIDGLEEMIKNMESTVMATSITDLIKELHMTMHNNDEASYVIPASDNLVSQYLLLYEISGGEDLEDLVDFGYQKTHISVQINKFEGLKQSEFNRITEYSQRHFPEGTRVTIVGDIPILIKMIERLTTGQIQSILIALMVITIVMIMVLKSIRLGLLSMIPNVIPVLVITGLMGILKYPLDLVTILIAPMIIGIAVDDTVHYFVHFKEEYQETGSYRLATTETFKKIGKALISTSVVLAAGFVIFALSKMASMGHMAVLAAAGIISALIADVVITPAVVVLLKPFKESLNSNNKEEMKL